MSAPIPLSDWQAATLPATLPRHLRRNVIAGEGGCWLWMRSKSRDGYGWASLDNRTHQAHRLVYRLIKGEPPAGLHLDHLCRVRHCVNPDHLEPVTPGENLRRGDTPAGWTVCRKCGDQLAWTGRQRRCLRCLAAYNERRREHYRLAARAYRARLRDAS